MSNIFGLKICEPTQSARFETNSANVAPKHLDRAGVDLFGYFDGLDAHGFWFGF